MSCEYIVKTERKKGKITLPDGTELFSYFIEAPQIDGIKSFNDFYSDVQRKCLDFCERKLAARCSQGHFYSYRLSCKTHIQNLRLTVILKATLTDKTSASLISSYTETHKWDFEKCKLRVIKS